jgi:hypothetical protein
MNNNEACQYIWITFSATSDVRLAIIEAGVINASIVYLLLKVVMRTKPKHRYIRTYKVMTAQNTTDQPLKTLITSVMTCPRCNSKMKPRSLARCPRDTLEALGHPK